MITAAVAYPPKRHLSLLAKLLIQKEPEVAQRLISTYLPTSEPIETDFSKITELFTRFCFIRGLEREDNVGPLYKSAKIDQRRIFVAAIIQLYHPRTRLLAKYLWEVLNQEKSRVSRLISEAEVRYRAYQEFREETNDIIIKLKKSGQ